MPLILFDAALETSPSPTLYFSSSSTPLTPARGEAAKKYESVFLKGFWVAVFGIGEPRTDADKLWLLRIRIEPRGRFDARIFGAGSPSPALSSWPLARDVVA